MDTTIPQSQRGELEEPRSINEGIACMSQFLGPIHPLGPIPISSIWARHTHHPMIVEMVLPPKKVSLVWGRFGMVQSRDLFVYFARLTSAGGRVFSGFISARHSREHHNVYNSIS